MSNNKGVVQVVLLFFVSVFLINVLYFYFVFVKFLLIRIEDFLRDCMIKNHIFIRVNVSRDIYLGDDVPFIYSLLKVQTIVLPYLILFVKGSVTTEIYKWEVKFIEWFITNLKESI